MAKNHDYAPRRKALPSSSHLKGKCASGKLRYRDHEMAIEALHKAWRGGGIAMRETGFTTRNEKRVYSCDRCKGWHLTHNETWAGSFGLAA